MIHFSGAPERGSAEERAATDRMMKLFEDMKAAATIITKGMIYVKE